MQFLHQMFNVSALPLDDALKPATPLTNRDQLNADISLGSVATHLRCGGIFSDSTGYAKTRLFLTVFNSRRPYMLT